MIEEIKENHDVVAEDWDGNLFCDISLNWNYIDIIFNIVMHGFIEKNI